MALTHCTLNSEPSRRRRGPPKYKIGVASYFYGTPREQSSLQSYKNKLNPHFVELPLVQSLATVGYCSAMTKVSRDDACLDLRGRRLPAAQIQQQHNNRVNSGSRRQPLSARVSSQDVVEMRSSDATLTRYHPNNPRPSSLPPRASALLRAVQRGDYGGLARLLESPNNRCHPTIKY